MPPTRARAAYSIWCRADHDVTDEVAAYKLAMDGFPGYFGIFHQIQRPTKNALEAKLIADTKAKTENAPPLELLQKTFARLS